MSGSLRAGHKKVTRRPPLSIRARFGSRSSHFSNLVVPCALTIICVVNEFRHMLYERFHIGE